MASDSESDIRVVYLDAAEAVLHLLRDARVAAAWSDPSALTEMTVGALACHLGGQIINVPGVLDEPLGEDVPVGLLEHYAMAPWVGAGPDGETNRGIRGKAEQAAADGPAALVLRVESALARLRGTLPTESAGRLVRLPWAGARRLDDFLTTRVLELIVHSDDLAVSLGDQDAPDLPPVAVDAVVALLARLAVRRHGAGPVIRALCRPERVPESITAI